MGQRWENYKGYVRESVRNPSGSITSPWDPDRTYETRPATYGEKMLVATVAFIMFVGALYGFFGR